MISRESDDDVGSCCRACPCEDETDKVGGDFESDDPPGIGDVDFGFRVLGEVSDLLFGQFREFDFHNFCFFVGFTIGDLQ